MRKATYSTYSIPGKTAALVPEFAVEDLPSSDLQPGSCACSEGPALGQNTDDDDDINLSICFCCYKIFLFYNNDNKL